MSTPFAPDWVEQPSDCFEFRMFLEFPVFARAGMQFESHLGHVFSLFRGLWAAECVQISFYGPLRGPIFVGGRCLVSCLGKGAAGYTFMAGSAANCMT